MAGWGFTATGHRVLLHLMAGSTRAAERWRSIRFTEFERRQIDAVTQELHAEYETANKACSASQQVRSLTGIPAVLGLDQWDFRRETAFGRATQEVATPENSQDERLTGGERATISRRFSPSLQLSDADDLLYDFKSSAFPQKISTIAATALTATAKAEHDPVFAESPLLWGEQRGQCRRVLKHPSNPGYDRWNCHGELRPQMTSKTISTLFRG